ncbi:MAG: hypothetical protein Q4C30_05040 [Bacteroidia bacterium]|nr:hypothetical protein [Bacteroidia bacterium]
MSRYTTITCGIAAIAAMIASSCSCDRSRAMADYDSEMDSTRTVSSEMEEDMARSKAILYTLPAPVEMATLIKESGLMYDDELLNPLSKVSTYTSNLQMALNLGVYTTDMSVASMFNQSQNTMEYLNNIKQLTEKLGIVQIVDDETLKKFEKKETTKEEILNIISDVYMNANQYLSDNNRRNVAAEVLVGGWIEGFHIAVSLAENNRWKNQKIQERIMAQKLAMNTVISILESENKDGQDEDLSYLQSKVAEIQVIFDEVRFETEGMPIVNIDEKAKTAYIKSSSHGEIQPDVLKMLCEKIKEIRNEIVK